MWTSWEPSKAVQDGSFHRASLRLYRKGRGVPQDIVQAYKWYSWAATNGDKPANELRNTIANQMIPALIAEAQTRDPVSPRSDRLQSVHDKLYTHRALTPLTRLRDGLEKMQFPAILKALAFPRC